MTPPSHVRRRAFGRHRLARQGADASVSAAVLLLCAGWAAIAWTWPAPPLDDHAHPAISVLWHRVASVLMTALVAIQLFVAVTFEQPD